MSSFDGHAQGVVNTNQIVRFKLTKRGQKILDDHNADVRATCNLLSNYSATKIDSDGRHSMQLHAAMRVFGAASTIGTESPFKNCSMYLER